MSFNIEDARKITPEEVEVLELINEGGQKYVFKGKLQESELKIAVKIYKTGVSEIQRAVREIKTMLELDSKYIVDLYAFDNHISKLNGTEEYIYTLEEYIEGKELGEILNSGYTYSIAELEEFFKKMLTALKEIWKHNIVHRDLKPENIMIKGEAPNNDPVIFDFGIARALDEESLTDSSRRIGPCTPPYAPPELLNYDKDLIDCRTDLFSLGIVGICMNTGKHPVWQDDLSQMKNIERMISESVPIPDSLRKLKPFVNRLVSKEPYRRLKNPTIALDMLEKL